MEKFYDDVGYNQYQKITDGVMTSNLSVQNLLSGAFRADYAGAVNGRDSQINFKNIKLNFTSMMSSGALSADEVGITSVSGDTYMMFKNFVDAGMMPDATKAIIKQYDGAWMRLQDTSKMSPEQLMGYNFGKNLVLKSPKETLKYFVDYPVLKDKADLGMSGALHIWSVDINRDNILALTKKMIQDYTGTGLTETDAKNIQESLAAMSFSGIMGYDPQNVNNSLVDGVIVQSGKTLMALKSMSTDTTGMVSVTEPEQQVTLALNYTKNGDNRNGTLAVNQAGTEMGKVNFALTKENGKFKELSLDGNAQGMPITMKHTVTGDSFVGKLILPVGTLDWSGGYKDKKLTALKMTGSSPTGTLTLNLTPDAGGMLRGPLQVKSSDQVLLDATVGLQVEPNKFGFVLDTKYSEMLVHFDLMSSANTTESKETITIPNATKSFQDLVNAINAANPAPTVPTYESEYMADPGEAMPVNSVSAPQ